VTSVPGSGGVWPILILGLITLFPGALYASETKQAYVILGWIVSLITFSFLPIFWWLFTKIRGLNVPSILIFLVSVLCIIPLGVSYIVDGAVLPNWYLIKEQRPIGVGGVLSNLVILIVNTLVFVKTRTKRVRLR
jgi:hypothetical protein